jgi:hypothetical protein
MSRARFYVAYYGVRKDGSTILPPVITAGPEPRGVMERTARRQQAAIHGHGGEYRVRTKAELDREEAERLEKVKGG